MKRQDHAAHGIRWQRLMGTSPSQVWSEISCLPRLTNTVSLLDRVSVLGIIIAVWGGYLVFGYLDP